MEVISSYDDDMDIVYKSQVVNRKDLCHEGKGRQAAFASLRGLGDISITETILQNF